MSHLQDLINQYCPDGVEFRAIKEIYKRLRGTAITATKMREIDNPDGNIRVFAGGKTVINTTESNIPNANVIRVPAVVVQSRGIIDFIYYDKPFTFKNEMWAYTSDSDIAVKFLYYVLVFCKSLLQKFAKGFCRFLQLHFVGFCKGLRVKYKSAIADINLPCKTREYPHQTIYCTPLLLSFCLLMR